MARRPWHLASATAAALTASLAGTADAALINRPNLTSITFWEVSGAVLANTLPFNGSEMTAVLPGLSTRVNDFQGVPGEFFDVFYSDPSGTFNLNGDCITIQADYQFNAGAHNLAAVDLNFTSGPSLRASILHSFVGLGINYAPGSELNAVDVDTPIPSTFTIMGDNLGNPSLRTSITVGFVPEPACTGILGTAVAALTARRRWRLPRCRNLNA